MKKTALLALAALAICFASCKKNQTAPQQPNSETATSKHFEIGNDYKYSKEIRVYNKANNEYYVDIQIASNTQEVFDEMSAFYNSAEIELVKDYPKNVKDVVTNLAKSNSIVNNRPALDKNSDDSNVVLYKNCNIGGAKGYRIINNSVNFTGKTNTYGVSLNGKWAVDCYMYGYVLFYEVYNYLPSVGGYDYYWNGSSWSFVQFKACNTGSTTTFSGITGFDRHFNGQSGGNISLYITVYI